MILGSFLVKARHIVNAGERSALRRLDKTADKFEKQHQPMKTVGFPDFLHQHGTLICGFPDGAEVALPRRSAGERSP